MVAGARMAAVLLLAALAVLPHVALAEERQVVLPWIGMSGSLQALSPVVLPQGSTLYSDSFFIVVFNHRSAPAEIRLGVEAPPGISVGFDPNETVFTLPPGGYKRFRVAVHVARDTVPGNHTVYVKAYVVERPEPGRVAVLEAPPSA
jgi:hypothetical protein